ncbi:MAG: hypothetical protein WCB79_01135 [Halobacteriota archaeon]
MVLVGERALSRSAWHGTPQFFKQQAYIFIARNEIDCDMGNFCTNGGKMRMFLQRQTNNTLCRDAAELPDIRAEDSLPSCAADLNLRNPEQ